MLSCKDVSELVSRSFEGDLTRLEGFRMRLHLLLCPQCACFHKHMHFLHDAVHLCAAADRAIEAPQSEAELSLEARDRINRALREKPSEGGELL